MGSPLRERGGVSDVVAAVLESARAGRGGSLFVEGEAGLGKSGVLGDVLRRVQRASHLCDEQQRTVVTHIRAVRDGRDFRCSHGRVGPSVRQVRRGLGFHRDQCGAAVYP